MGTGIVIAKTVLTTVDVILAAVVIAGTDKKNRKTIGTGAAVFVALNIVAMWL